MQDATLGGNGSPWALGDKLGDLRIENHKRAVVAELQEIERWNNFGKRWNNFGK